MADIFDNLDTKKQPPKNGDVFDQLDTDVGEYNPSVSPLSSAAGALGGAAGAFALYKSRIPQNIGKFSGALASGISNLPKVTNTEKGTDFAQKVRGAFIQAHTDKVNSFVKNIEELSLNNPTRQVSLSNVADDIRNNWNDMTPEAKRVIRNTPVLKDMVSDLWDKKAKIKPTDISLKQSQEISNYINTKLPPNIRANNIDVIETLNNVRGAQLEAFPEMEQVRADYRKFIEPYNNVKQYFKFNKLLNAIKNKFGGAEGQKAVEKILPKEVIKKLGGYRAAARLAELPQDIPLVGKLFRSLGGINSIALGTIDPTIAVVNQEMGASPQEVLQSVISGKPIQRPVSIPESYQNQIMSKETLMKLLDEQRKLQRAI